MKDNLILAVRVIQGQPQFIFENGRQSQFFM